MINNNNNSLVTIGKYTEDDLVKLWHDIENKQKMFKLYNIKNMPLPARFNQLKKFQKKPDYIIIHDTNCLDHKTAALTIDTPQNKIGEIKSNQIVLSGMKNINYHFLIDRIDNDYEVIMARPLHYLCHHPDILSSYKYSLHVLILFDLTVDIAKRRLYQVMAYKCIAPIMKMLHMNLNPKNTIQYHNEVINKRFEQKDDKEMVRNYGYTRNISNCPGNFLFKPLLVTEVQKYL